MNHRKLMHIQTVALCKNKLEGNCNFTAEKCWWNHEESQNKKVLEIACYICDETFSSKTKMMIHRKSYHPRVVRKCTNFSENNCKFLGSSCWFIHEEVEEMEIEEECEERKEDMCEEMKESVPVFQNASGKKKPPIVKQSKQKMD